jgi:hypothetical protein
MLSIGETNLRQYHERPEWLGRDSPFLERSLVMKSRTLASTLLAILLALATAARAVGESNPAASRQFEVLKGLAGDWVAIGADGKPTDKLVSSIRVTSAGHTVQETVFPGSDHEMVTMYHLDGPDLILTHYCMLGNQPRMRAKPSGHLDRIDFEFIGGTNLKSQDDHHMHRATLAIDGKDRIKTEWVSCKDGQTCHQVKFDLVRKSK